MKRLNLPLLAGGIIIVIIVLVMIFPQKLTHFNPYVIEGVKAQIQKNGSLAMKGAPFSPSKTNILGTDFIGRDELCLIIYGTRLTIGLGLLVVLGRFLVAVPIGIAAGFGSSFCKSATSLFGILFSAIPALIISIVTLKISFFLGLFKSQSILAFVIVLTVVGWAKLSSLIKERVENILKQPFIMGERAIGKSGFKIAVENVLPHLAPELTVLFFMEMALALSMIMQLGFFGVYVGNLRVVADTAGGVIQTMNISYEPEWASMLSTSIDYLRQAPWTVLTPSVTFFISIFGFNMFGEGIRSRLQNKDSKLNLRILTKKSLKIAAAAAGCLLIAAGIYRISAYYQGRAAAEQAMSIVDNEFKDQVLIGSSEAEYTSEKLSLLLKKAGFKPIGENYIQSYDIPKLYSAQNYSLDINNEEDDSKLILGKDFSLEGYGTYALKGSIYDARSMDMFNIKDYSIFDNKFVMLDENIYSNDAVKYFSDIIDTKSKALGVIDIVDGTDSLTPVIGSEASGKALIYMTRKASEKLHKSSVLSLNMEGCSLQGKGRNVVGILPGSDPKLSKEAIMISMGYNYMSYDKDDAVSKLRMMIQAAKLLKDSSKDQGRPIIIAFWDGNLTSSYTGVGYYTDKPVYSLVDTAIDVDLTDMNINTDTVLMDSEQVHITRYFAWAFNHELEASIKGNGMKLKKYTSTEDVASILERGPNSKEVMYYKGSVPSILTLGEPDNQAFKKTQVKDNFIKALVSAITNINY